MTLRDLRKRLFAQGALQRLLGPTAVAAGCLFALPASSAPPSAYLPQPAAAPVDKPAPAQNPAAADRPGSLTADAAVRYALLNNPEITALRQQHHIAAAGVVIARAYPFNPLWESNVQGAFGPESAGVTNSVPFTQRVALELEIRHQRQIREEGAAATLSRTDWEIANQELALTIRVLRAFDTVVYRYRKLELLRRSIKENEDARDLVRRLAGDPNKGITRADIISIDTELLKATGPLALGQAALVAAWQDFYRALGVTSGSFDLSGGLETPPPLETDPEQMALAAEDRRPDVRARRLAVSEAEAKLRLEVANRFGNPTLGPSMEYTESRGVFVGLQFTMPVPILNAHRADIQQRQAEQYKTVLELNQAEVGVRQDVRAAVARLEHARKLVGQYHDEVLPKLQEAVTDIKKLFEARQPGADLLKVIDVQRKLLDARDAELDAVFELRQALADLAAAVGDPSVAIVPSPKP
jgi:outer membrane protein TolC